MRGEKSQSIISGRILTSALAGREGWDEMGCGEIKKEDFRGWMVAQSFSGFSALSSKIVIPDPTGRRARHRCLPAPGQGQGVLDSDKSILGLLGGPLGWSRLCFLHSGQNPEPSAGNRSTRLEGRDFLRSASLDSACCVCQAKGKPGYREQKVQSRIPRYTYVQKFSQAIYLPKF